VQNRAKFSTFWPSQIFGVRALKNLYNSDHAHYMAYHGATPSTLKLMGANTLNFKPILDSRLKKNVRGPRTRWGCASKFWSFSSAWPKYGFPKKSIWVGIRFHRLISVITGPKFTGLFTPNAGGIAVQTS